MRFVVDSMQKVCLDGVGGEGKVEGRSEETTLIHHIFGGVLLSKVHVWAGDPGDPGNPGGKGRGREGSWFRIESWAFWVEVFG